MKTAAQVLVFPAWRDNPFLNLLSLSARSSGYRFLDATNFNKLLEQADRLQDRDIFHLHWTYPLLQNAPSEEGARARLSQFSEMLQSLRQRGVTIIWTIHNRIPHELHYREPEIELHHLLASEADAIHIMAPDTPAVMSDVVELDPAKIHVIPHPSYQGVYDVGVDRDTARRSFGLEADDRSVLFLGQIRPYKGVQALIEATSLAAKTSNSRLVLMLAGVVKDLRVEDFTAAIPDHLATRTLFDFVPDGDLSRWFRAADVAVFPYQAILNSGSVHLAATFGVPTLLPGEDHLRRQFGDEPWVAFFDKQRPAESIAELLNDPELFKDVTEHDFTRFTSGIGPWDISRQYHRLIDRYASRPLPDQTSGPLPTPRRMRSRRIMRDRFTARGAQ